MSKKIKIAQYTLVSVFIVIFIGILCLAFMQSDSVIDINGTKASAVDSHCINIKWKGDGSVDGYYVYQYNQKNKSFEKIADLSPGVSNYDVKELRQASEYQFYVTAYRYVKDEILESENYSVVKAKTQPTQQTLEDAYSLDKGQLVIQWTENPRADGYFVEYSSNENFKNAEKIDIDDVTTTEKEFKELEVGESYYSRVCSYVKDGESVITGEWSQPQAVTISDKISLSDDIDVTKPMIALTFDDGPPYNQASERILDVLEEYNARATFFMVGVNAADHPNNLKRKLELGCELGSHTYSHKNYGKNVTAADITKASEAIYAACGEYPTAFRSPGGNTNDFIREQCKKEGLPLYYWSIDTEDWKSKDADKIYKKVMDNVKDGDIILMHEIYSSSAEAVEKLVPALIKQGYQLVTCQELIEAKTGKKPVPGQQYYNGTSIRNTTN